MIDHNDYVLIDIRVPKKFIKEIKEGRTSKRKLTLINATGTWAPTTITIAESGEQVHIPYGWVLVELPEKTTTGDIWGNPIEYCPISITEEWLLKIDTEHVYRNKNILIEAGRITLDGGNECSWRIDFQYIHQLENLYFALTGEELPYNL